MPFPQLVMASPAGSPSKPGFNRALSFGSGAVSYPEDEATSPLRVHATSTFDQAPDDLQAQQMERMMSRMQVNTHPTEATTLRDQLYMLVKIFVVEATPNYLLPWQVNQQAESSGSGFVIQGNRILTNSHVVCNQTAVRVRKEGDPHKYSAKVLCVGHDCDLAIITVDDPVFWEGVIHSSFGELPNIGDDVRVLGYPMGGDNISVTRGVVSRIDTMPYTQGAEDLLVVQIDAAINPGNSGGPVFDTSGHVIGAAFSGIVNASNIGFIIPTVTIFHFLSQYDTQGKYVGICGLGTTFQLMENDHLRQAMKMTSKHTGVFVTKVSSLGPFGKVLKPDDVVMAIDGVPIANDASVPLSRVDASSPVSRERVNFRHLVTSKQSGDEIQFSLWRDGSCVEVTGITGLVPRLVPLHHNFDAYPTYFIFGGLVFAPLSLPLFTSMAPVVENIAPHLVLEMAGALPQVKKQHEHEAVVLQHVLISNENFGYNRVGPAMLKKVNNVDVDSMKHLVTLIKSSESQYIRFTFTNDKTIILDHALCMAAEEEILSKNAIPHPLSKDLQSKLTE